MDAAEALEPTWISRLVEVLQPLSLRADRLAATALFAGMARPDLEVAAGLVSEALVDRGARMAVQGLPCAKLWLILEGQAMVSADARPIRVARYGDLVGLESMLGATGSPETTIALSPIRAFSIDRDQFRRLMAHPPVRARLSAAASARRRSSAGGSTSRSAAKPAGRWPARASRPPRASQAAT
jgi:CRP-like cAMP-binding protein